jgi:hypothetical protein
VPATWVLYALAIHGLERLGTELDAGLAPWLTPMSRASARSDKPATPVCPSVRSALDSSSARRLPWWYGVAGSVMASSSRAEAIWPPANAVRPGARFVCVKDPEGNLIELVQPA